MLIPHNQITLTDLQLDLYLGWPDEERLKKQPLFVTLEMRFREMPAGCKNDDLQDTVCYDEVSQKITAHCEQKIYKLIEHLAYDVYQTVKAAYPLDCRVTITKKPAIPNLIGTAAYTCGDWS